MSLKYRRRVGQSGPTESRNRIKKNIDCDISLILRLKAVRAFLPRKSKTIRTPLDRLLHWSYYNMTIVVNKHYSWAHRITTNEAIVKHARNNKLSPGEMEIMSMLWEHGPLTLSLAHEQLGRPIGYTTMQTRLNRLVEKGLATRSDERPACYAAAISQQDVSANHLELLVDRVTRGNIVPLVAHLVDDRSLTPEEIGELKRIIRDAERRLKEDAS